MSLPTLHILNGDAIAGKFKAIFPDQKYIVWREALCQGPLQYRIQEQEFKFKRLDFLNAHLSPAASADSVNENHHLIDDLMAIDLDQFDEVVLWFEYDLFCQINMMAAISWIIETRMEIAINILDLEGFQSNGFVGLGHINQQHYRQIFDDRILLSFEEKKYIDVLWSQIAAGEYKIIPLLKTFDKLIRFNHAMKTVAIFSNQNGLGAAWVEARIIELLKASKLEKMNLLGKVLSLTEEIGYGDVQIEYIINREIKEGRLIEGVDHYISLPI